MVTGVITPLMAVWGGVPGKSTMTLELHQRLATQSAAQGKSINAWGVELLSERVSHRID